MTKTKVVNLNREDYDVYIGRGQRGENMLNTDPTETGWLGNPFMLSEFSREESIEKFKEAFYEKLENDDEFKHAVKSIKGQTLGCFCKPLDCHGDVIKEYLDSI